MKTISEIRAAFWEAHPQFAHLYRSWRQNQYPADVRCAFVDFVDQLARSGEITSKLAFRATL
jgi:hypothetical protein